MPSGMPLTNLKKASITKMNIESSIISTLEHEPKIDGLSLINKVIAEVDGASWDNVTDHLDLLIDENIVIFNTEEDEWSLS